MEKIASSGAIFCLFGEKSKKICVIENFVVSLLPKFTRGSKQQLLNNFYMMMKKNIKYPLIFIVCCVLWYINAFAVETQSPIGKWKNYLIYEKNKEKNGIYWSRVIPDDWFRLVDEGKLDNDDKWGVVMNDSLIIPCKYALIYYKTLDEADKGVFEVVSAKEKYAHGYYSLNGKCIIRPRKGVTCKREKLKYSKLIIYKSNSIIRNEDGQVLSPYGMSADILYDDCHQKEYIYISEEVSGNTDNRIGLMDLSGNILIPLDRNYYHIEPLNYKDRTFFLVGDKTWGLKHLGYSYNGHWGLVDESFNEIIAPNKYQIIEIIKNSNLLKISNNRYSNKYGVCNLQGREILTSEYDDIQYAGKNCIKFKQNGYWGLVNANGKILIPISRCYTSISNYETNKKSFAFTKDGYKGECNNLGEQVSMSKIPSLSTNNIAKSSASNSTINNSSLLLYKGYYTHGDDIDIETGTIMGNMHLTNEVEIYEDYIKEGVNYATYYSTNSSGTRVYKGKDPFGTPLTYYVSKSFEITLIQDLHSQWGYNRIRTYFTKGEMTYSPSKKGNDGNSHLQSSISDKSSNNRGLSATQYQQLYNGYEKVAIGVFNSFNANPNMNAGPRSQNMQILQGAQRDMLRIRQEAASHGITIPQSHYETATP